MTLYRKIFSKFNIQIFIIFVSVDYIIADSYAILDYRYMSSVDYSMLKFSILNLLINLVLYILFLKNRISLDRMVEKYNNNDIDIISIESIVKKTKLELNLITASLIVFAIYASYYFLYVIFYIGMSQ